MSTSGFLQRSADQKAGLAGPAASAGGGAAPAPAGGGGAGKKDGGSAPAAPGKSTDM